MERKILDDVDKFILRILYDSTKPLTGNQIAIKVNLSPSAVSPRLKKLENEDLIIKHRSSRPRVFSRNFNERVKVISSPRSIYWRANIERGFN